MVECLVLLLRSVESLVEKVLKLLGYRQFRGPSTPLRVAQDDELYGK
jgi:hypothetical protein